LLFLGKVSFGASVDKRFTVHPVLCTSNDGIENRSVPLVVVNGEGKALISAYIVERIEPDEAQVALAYGELSFQFFDPLPKVGDLALKHDTFAKLGMQQRFQTVSARISQQIAPSVSLFGVANRQPGGCKSEHEHRNDQYEAYLRAMLG